jgi:nitroimidazol reductase NimA-like FMN-containing flavoprotein (pyridoxamine 5'-phosphate oxidase superfamily)
MGRSALVGQLESVHDEAMRTNSKGQQEQGPTASELLELDPAQILELLQTHTLGRVVFAQESWPVILPVNYAFADPTIVIRTGSGAKLASGPFHAAAFEIDDADPKGCWGWSVLVQGRAFEITYARDINSHRLRELVGQPVAPGVRDHWLVISALKISGRSFGAPPDFPSRSRLGHAHGSALDLANLL